jgi:hypothetical protein
MRKYSQEELLNEGVWGAVKAIGRGADYLIGKAAPEVQKLYKDPINAAVGLKDAVMGNTVKNPNYGKPVTQNIINSISTGLQRNGNRLSFEPIKYYTYSKELKKDVYGATIIDRTTNKKRLIYVDKNGVELTPPVPPASSTPPTTQPPTTPPPTP